MTDAMLRLVSRQEHVPPHPTSHIPYTLRTEYRQDSEGNGELRPFRPSAPTRASSRRLLPDLGRACC
jgi:hypothetical protein